jgi:hypothetical protein
MNKSIFKALGVLAQNKGMNKYLNIFKETGEGIKSQGMDFFNRAIKQVVDEGDQIETTLTTKKYVHPDRPDIFVEVDTSTGNANVGLVDPEAGAFAYTDEMKKEQLIESLEDEGLGAMGARARADEILTMREKAKMMREIGKSKIKNKRQAMIDAYNRIIKEKNKKADGGRVGMFMGGKLPQGAGLLRQMIKMAAKEKGLEKPSEMLSKFNPKKVDKFTNDPNLLFMKADVKEGIMATDKIKNFKDTAQSGRIDIVSYLLEMAKELRSTNLTFKAQNDVMINEAVRLGMDRKQAEFLVKGLSEGVKRSTKFPPPGAPEPTDQGILELETILKNLKTGGKPSRSLNADGGRVGLRYGGDTMGGPNDKSNQDKGEVTSDAGFANTSPSRVEFDLRDLAKTQQYSQPSGVLAAGLGDGPVTLVKDNKTPFVQLKPYSVGSTNIGLNAILANRGLLSALIDPIESLEDDQLVGDLSFTTGIGPVGLNIGTDFEGNKNLQMQTGIPLFGGTLSGDLRSDLEGNTGVNFGFRKELKDGGDVSLTVIEIPDISGSGVETLFKNK